MRSIYQRANEGSTQGTVLSSCFEPYIHPYRVAALETIAMSVEKYHEHDQSSDPSTAIYAIDSETEKRLLRKIDLRIVCAFSLNSI
jgi:hypothetical protein